MSPMIPADVFEEIVRLCDISNAPEDMPIEERVRYAVMPVLGQQAELDEARAEVAALREQLAAVTRERDEARAELEVAEDVIQVARRLYYGEGVGVYTAMTEALRKWDAVCSDPAPCREEPISGQTPAGERCPHCDVPMALAILESPDERVEKRVCLVTHCPSHRDAGAGDGGAKP